MPWSSGEFARCRGCSKVLNAFSLDRLRGDNLRFLSDARMRDKTIYVSMSDLWRAQEVRQQRVAREAGRIGHIGNAGPALGTTLPSSSR
jgi:hypothetical protein